MCFSDVLGSQILFIVMFDIQKNIQMKPKSCVVILLLISFVSFSQSKKIERLRDQTINIGKMLYRSEMASWYGTDVFLERHEERKSDIGGYFSYPDGELTKCIFFSKAETPKVIGTIIFDDTFNVEEAIVDGNIRSFNEVESEYYKIRTIAFKEINENKDGLYSFYKETSLNLIPFISQNEKKVYVLTGTTKSGVVLFGNDYLITFDKKNKISGQKKLHKSLVSVEYKGSVSAMHNHLPEYSELITETDICTLMLNQKFTNWESYYVISKEYVSIWNCKTAQLIVMTKKAWDTMNDNIKKLEEKKTSP